MNKKRIAIITHYYNSLNYGGNLQAYALCEAIGKEIDCSVEQICFEWSKERINYKTSSILIKKVKKCLSKVINLLFHFPSKIHNRILKLKYRKLIQEYIETKKKNFESFNSQIIPHSKDIYSRVDIAETLKYYDVFITGSDQVWNTNWYNPMFFLDFVGPDKTKISYAASISKESLTEEEKIIFKKSLLDFNAVSVREEKATELLNALSPVSPQLVLDPTLLLDQEDWDKVCQDRVVEDSYLFCYFLGDNKRERYLALQYAKLNNLKVVSVPFTGVCVYSDVNFGDIILPSVSPQEFISLIKHASYVFTDSFHAVVLSQIYQRQYFVFNRDKKGTMNSRIINITDLFNTHDRFCNGKEKETLKYIQSLKDIDYSIPNTKLYDMKQSSIKFLKDNLV